jgi:hypothetical protein
MALDAILKAVKKKFSPQKRVTFEEEGLVFILEPISIEEEQKIMEVTKDIEGANYFDSLKRYTVALSIKQINDEVISSDTITYKEAGELLEKSRFLYMTEQVSSWPSPLIDKLFDVYTDLISELESTIKNGAKFKRFSITDKLPSELKAEIYKKIEVPEPEKDENEKLQERVEQELAQADEQIANQ